MSCEQYREIISAAMDGEADEEELMALRAHLEECPECRAYREALAGLSELLDTELPEPGPSFTESVMDAVREAERSKKVIRLRARRRYTTLAASLLLVAGLGLAAAQSRGKSAPQTPMMMMAAAPAEAAVCEEAEEEEFVYANEYNDNDAADNSVMNPGDAPAENGVYKFVPEPEEPASSPTMDVPAGETDGEEGEPAPMMTMAAPVPAPGAEPEAPAGEPEKPAPMFTMMAPAAGTAAAEERSECANALPDYITIVRAYLLSALPEAAADLDDAEAEIFSLEAEELPDRELCTEGCVPVGRVTAVRFASPSLGCTLTVFVDETGTVFGILRA